MKQAGRGMIKRITIELEYPNGDEYTRVIEGDTLERLALIAFTEQAIQQHLRGIKAQDQALRTFAQGSDKAGRDRPAMLLLYADGSYAMECDWSSHHPGRLR